MFIDLWTMFAGVSLCGCVISLVLNFEQTMHLSRWNPLLVGITVFYVCFVNRSISFVYAYLWLFHLFSVLSFELQLTWQTLVLGCTHYFMQGIMSNFPLFCIIFYFNVLSFIFPFLFIYNKNIIFLKLISIYYPSIFIYYNKAMSFFDTCEHFFRV